MVWGHGFDPPAARAAPATLPLIGLGAAIGALELVCGFVYPAMALNLEARGASLALIGSQAAMVGPGPTLSALLVPWLSGRLGALRLGLANLALASLAVLALGLLDGVGWWFASPCCSASPSTSGMYALMALAGAAAGLALPRLRQHLAQPRAPQMKEFMATVRAIPALLLAVVASGYFSGAVLPFWLIYATGRGLATDQATLTLTLIVLGNIALQLPIGWLADKAPGHRVLAGCALGTVLGALLLPVLDLACWLAWPCLLAWGALSFGVYTVALVLIGRLPPERLVVATAAFGAMWGLGMLLGSALTGHFMAVLGPGGLPLAIVLAYLPVAGLARRAVPARATLRQAPRPLPA